MNVLDEHLSKHALELLGKRLLEQKISPVSLYVIGGAAGLLTGAFKQQMTTGDCDIMSIDPSRLWEHVEHAASAVATELDLLPDWLNRDCRVFGHDMPLGWRSRAKLVVESGPLTVYAMSRKDMVAVKVTNSVIRANDMRHLLSLQPTNDELAFAHEHLDRLDSEDLNRDVRDAQRAVIDSLWSTP